jgi:acylphosphatase
MNVRAHAIFEGRVQGVFFRASTKECADSHRLTGWVRNMSDGKVEAVFEGDEEKVHLALEQCSRSRGAIRVDSRKVEMGEATGEFRGFSILHD